MRLICHHIEKEKIPKEVREHDDYINENHEEFFIPFNLINDTVKEVYTVKVIQKAIVDKDPNYLQNYAVGVLGGKEIRAGVKVNWDATNYNLITKAEKIDYDMAEEVLLDIYHQTGETIGKKEIGALKIGTSFRLENPAVLGLIKTRTGDLITDMDSTTRRTLVQFVKNTIHRGYGAGLSPKILAKQIQNKVGIHPSFMRWFTNHSARLQADGLVGNALHVAEQKYANFLISYRAKMIARTEMAFAMQRGQEAAWDKAIKSGLIEKTAKKVWLAVLDKRTSDICRELSYHQPINVTEDFTYGAAGGGSTSMAPAHPNCRSVAKLVR